MHIFECCVQGKLSNGKKPQFWQKSRGESIATCITLMGPSSHYLGYRRKYAILHVAVIAEAVVSLSTFSFFFCLSRDLKLLFLLLQSCRYTRLPCIYIVVGVGEVGGVWGGR